MCANSDSVPCDQGVAKQPLLVRLIFHPDSQPSRDLAKHIHRKLNDDVIVPGLSGPTLFCPMSNGARPPEEYPLDLAERNFIVPLADDRLNVDEEWSRF